MAETFVGCVAEDREVSLRGARRIIIRTVRPSDDVGLVALYDELDDEDRHRRFFGSFHPRLEFFADMANVAERGGARLVAVLAERGFGEHGPIIGEAGYVLLPNGDGEFAMAVARRWRGWLGPYLLDALVETAAAAGVPNLEADVLAVNRPMLAVLRARGSVVMDHEDWTVLRLLFGTGGRVPTWPGPHDRLRVLVEGSGGRWHAEKEAHAAGLQLLTCPGPVNSVHGCPALAGRTCPLAADADVIVVSHPTDDHRWDRTAGRPSGGPRGVPVCLEPSHDRTEATGAPSRCVT